MIYGAVKSELESIRVNTFSLETFEHMSHIRSTCLRAARKRLPEET